MTPQWVKYDGSDEQIAEMVDSGSGYILKTVSGRSKDIEFDTDYILYSHEITQYLICKPHPYADMICQWARTGQPVWVRYAKVCHFGQTSEYEICNQIATLTPDWNIPGAEYSFTPFEEEV